MTKRCAGVLLCRRAGTTLLNQRLSLALPRIAHLVTTLLEDITSRDPHRVWLSSGAIIKLRDAAQLDSLAMHLAEIRAATENLDLGGALFSNAGHLAFALRKLEYHQQRAGCLCQLYTGYQFFNPEQEAEAGNISIDAITYIKDKWIDRYSCTCTQCGAKFSVKEGESHYTWWEWSTVSE